MRERVARAFGARELRADYADAGDFLRVICVGLVGWFHIWQQSWLNPNLELGSFTLKLYPLVSCGYMFVDLMLMLTGFLLMLGWLSGRGRDARTFYAGARGAHTAELSAVRAGAVLLRGAAAGAVRNAPPPVDGFFWAI